MILGRISPAFPMRDKVAIAETGVASILISMIGIYVLPR